MFDFDFDYDYDEGTDDASSRFARKDKVETKSPGKKNNASLTRRRVGGFICVYEVRGRSGAAACAPHGTSGSIDSYLF